ncbi:MAG: zinc-ribbon domain-containing protein [bacterium]|nr:zinc-ribbon domain-containing protein [bacterium]
MSDRFCPQCGAKSTGDAKFCSECGTPVSASANKSAKPGGKSTAPKSGMRDLIIVVGVLAIVAVGYFLIVDRPEPPSPQPQQQAAQQPMQNIDPHAEENLSMAMLDSLPKDYNSLIQTAYHYHDMGSQTRNTQNFAIAAEIYRRALAIDSSDPNVRVDYGAVLHGMGLPQRSLEEFGKVLKTLPRHGVANFNMGIVHHDVGNSDSAKIYFNRYLEYEPNGPASQAARDFLKELGG